MLGPAFTEPPLASISTPLVYVYSRQYRCNGGRNELIIKANIELVNDLIGGVSRIMRLSLHRSIWNQSNPFGIILVV